MPRISEPTVAEHRAAQHRAVLAAAEKLIAASDGQMPTLGDVAAEVGLARSSVYLYAASRQDLLIQLLLEAIPAWTDSLQEALTGVGDDPGDRVAAYVSVTLDLFLGGSHGPLMAAAQQFPEAFTDERVQHAHDALHPARVELIGDHGVAFALVDAAIARGAELVQEAGEEADLVKPLVERMARAAVAGDLEDRAEGR